MLGTFSIPVVTSKRVNKVIFRYNANLPDLIHIPCEPKSALEPIIVNSTIKMGLLNVRSLAHKSFLFNDLITTCKLDFMFLTNMVGTK